MKLEYYEDIKTDEIRINIIIYPLDFFEIELDDFDRLLLRECDKSNKISDKLLALETIARKLEKASNKRIEPTS